MHLFELAYCCRLYGQLTTYDSSLSALRKAVGPQLNPANPDHRAALFQWLNAWGCRQFAKEHHATTASHSLTAWANHWAARLPGPATQLTDVSPSEVAMCVAAYAALRDSIASTRLLPGGRKSSVTYGPTGAAKTLFALRPNLVPPWDDQIRDELKLDGGVASFGVHLTSVATQLRALAKEAAVKVPALPALIGRPKSSPPKLIDEFNWVVITKGLRPPAVADLEQWNTWARKVGN